MIYNPPQVDRIWDIWGSYYNIPKVMFCLHKGEYTILSFEMPARSQADCQQDCWMLCSFLDTSTIVCQRASSQVITIGEFLKKGNFRNPKPMSPIASLENCSF